MSILCVSESLRLCVEFFQTSIQAFRIGKQTLRKYITTKIKILHNEKNFNTLVHLRKGGKYESSKRRYRPISR